MGGLFQVRFLGAALTNDERTMTTADQVKENVSHNILILLAKHDMTQSELANRADVSKMQVWRYINRLARCNVDDCARITAVFGVRLDKFVLSQL